MDTIIFREKYVKECRIGSGTYGVVYKVREKESNRIYAVKKITLENLEDGIPASTMREIGILLELNVYKHPNIISIQEIIHRNGQISIVYEYAEWDLKKFMESGYFEEASKFAMTNTALPITLVLITGKVLFPGDSEIDELFLIFRMLGTPNDHTWKGVSKFPDYKSDFPKFSAIGLQNLNLPAGARSVLKHALQMNPQKRATVEQLNFEPFLQNAIMIPLQNYGKR
ncbi:Cell division control protein 2 like [Paragonimus heterotremus]|uniref:cyclin-dependent kinase n=1 Tax=Paragonimus heterotremus TaxID=100268 RepID=A0A8J4SNQ0_9TREM|nr:Cell division control protein 2 like [Paragonimus heterotremus]